MKSLDRPFKHRSWYLHSHLTVRDFLELAAEGYRTFYVKEKKIVKSDNLLEEPELAYYIKCDEDNSSYRITYDEYKYFVERREFWRKWNKDFLDKYYTEHIDYRKYINLKNEEKEKVPEYKQAHEKVVIH